VYGVSACVNVCVSVCVYAFVYVCVCVCVCVCTQTNMAGVTQDNTELAQPQHQTHRVNTTGRAQARTETQLVTVRRRRRPAELRALSFPRRINGMLRRTLAVHASAHAQPYVFRLATLVSLMLIFSAVLCAAASTGESAPCMHASTSALPRRTLGGVGEEAGRLAFHALGPVTARVGAGLGWEWGGRVRGKERPGAFAAATAQRHVRGSRLTSTKRGTRTLMCLDSIVVASVRDRHAHQQPPLLLLQPQQQKQQQQQQMQLRVDRRAAINSSCWALWGMCALGGDKAAAYTVDADNNEGESEADAAKRGEWFFKDGTYYKKKIEVVAPQEDPEKTRAAAVVAKTQREDGDARQKQQEEDAKRERERVAAMDGVRRKQQQEDAERERNNVAALEGARKKQEEDDTERERNNTAAVLARQQLANQQRNNKQIDVASDNDRDNQGRNLVPFLALGLGGAGYFLYLHVCVVYVCVFRY